MHVPMYMSMHMHVPMHMSMHMPLCMHSHLYNVERARAWLEARLMEGVEDVHVLLADRLDGCILLATPLLLHHLDVRLVTHDRDKKVVALRLSARTCVDAVRSMSGSVSGSVSVSVSGSRLP
jgi:hypothetical protein